MFAQIWSLTVISITHIFLMNTLFTNISACLVLMFERNTDVQGKKSCESLFQIIETHSVVGVFIDDVWNENGSHFQVSSRLCFGVVECQMYVLMNVSVDSCLSVFSQIGEACLVLVPEVVWLKTALCAEVFLTRDFIKLVC